MTGMTRSVDTNIRYWQRTSKPMVGWWPGAILPLLAFIAIFAFAWMYAAPEMIEGETADAVRASLVDAGFDDLRIRVDGQDIVIRGEGVQADEGYIRALAASTTCDSLLGNLICPNEVHVSLSSPSHSFSRFHDFIWQKSADGVLLQGDVPTEELKEEMLALASEQNPIVYDELVVSDENASEDFVAAFRYSSILSEHVAEGVVSWTNGELHVDGTTASDEQRTLAQNTVHSAKEEIHFGSFELSTDPRYEECDREMNELLSHARIRFTQGNANLSISATHAMEGVGDIMMRCPGRFVIEGHSDSRGDAETNQRLSEIRATAIRDALINYGVEPERLVSMGFGQDRPVGDNKTLVGRARNRRIEIRVR